jgi:hypothetical protein
MAIFQGCENHLGSLRLHLGQRDAITVSSQYVEPGAINLPKTISTQSYLEEEAAQPIYR